MKKKLLALSVLAAISSQANAFQFDTGDDWAIRWDNTFKVNIMSRVAKQDDDVITGQADAGWTLASDADRSVDRSGAGLVSTRIDVISEMDVIWKDNFGFRVSGSGWYDPEYKNSNNDHPSDIRSVWSSPSADFGDYNHEAKDLHYAGGELLDAFVFANFDIGDTALGVRAGRHTIYWGNGLLTNGALHGFGGSMAPLDFNKALSVPGSEAKELFMPTGKISSTLQLTDNLTLNAYYGYEFQAYRVPEDGTYWSPASGLSENSEFMTIWPQGDLNDPVRAGFNSGGFSEEEGDIGFNLQYFIEPWGLEVSAIYLNITDKNLNGLSAASEFSVAAQVIPALAPVNAVWQQFCGLNIVPCPPPLEVNDDGTIVTGGAKWIFKDDIDVLGISLAKEIAGISVGVDLVARLDTGLAPDLPTALGTFKNVPEFVTGATGITGITDEIYQSYDSSNYPGAYGDTYHVVINGLGLLNGDKGLWDGGTYIIEATFSMLDDCNKNCKQLDSRVSEGRVVSQIAGIFVPTWYQVRPGWDMSIPMAVNYTIDGEKAPMSFAGDEEAGSASIGVRVDIEQQWKVDFAYNIRFGPVLAGIGGLLKDRDNVSLTVKRTW
jgi:hypothetical protein